MTWLLNSMVPSISKNFLLYTTAADIWSAVRETYSSTNNIAELYHIEDQATALKQETMPVTLYYNTLNALWQKLDLYEQHDWVDPRDVALYQTITTQHRIFQFLHGLNKDIDEARGRILAMTPLPSIREVFSTVKKEASRRSVMLSKESHISLEGSALLINPLVLLRRAGHGVIIVRSLVTRRTSVRNFMALDLKKMIGKAGLQNGLYIIPSSSPADLSSSFTALG
ncbi:hypothetical protein V6N13_040111 [Hibiscus sabdariffa]